MAAPSKANSLFVSASDFFTELVDTAMEHRRVQTYPQARQYLVTLLEHYMDAGNLYEIDEVTGKRTQNTLAELFLRADHEPPARRVDVLKKLGDMSLYISGFFGDSLNRKLVDIDYYAEMGGTAYYRLAGVVREDTTAKVYQEFSERFLEFVEVLTYISQQAFVQSDQELLRLYDRYLRTGSALARERLEEMGVSTIPLDQAKYTKQN